MNIMANRNFEQKSCFYKFDEKSICDPSSETLLVTVLGQKYWYSALAPHQPVI